jgi:hypothetical protein
MKILDFKNFSINESKTPIINESYIPKSELYWELRNKTKKFNLILKNNIDCLFAGIIFYKQMLKKGFTLNKVSFIEFEDDKNININLISTHLSDIQYDKYYDPNSKYLSICNFFGLDADSKLAQIILEKNKYDVLAELLDVENIDIKYIGHLVKTINYLLGLLTEIEFKTILTKSELTIDDVFDEVKKFKSKLHHFNKSEVFNDCDKSVRIYGKCVVFPKDLKVNLYLVQKYIREKDLTNPWYIFFKEDDICVWGENLEKLQDIFDGWDWYQKNTYLIFREATVDELLKKLN